MSPDGRWLAFNRVPGVNLQSWRVVSFTQAATGQPVPIPHPIGETGFPIRARCAWTDDSAQWVCVEEAAGGSRLVRVPVPGPGKPEPILAAGTNTSEPAIARQAGQLAYAHAFRNTNLWRADLREPKAPPVRVIASTRAEMQPDYSPDGGRIAFISSRSGANEVWTASADGSNSVQITTQALRPTAPR
jgi:Tol biopolymer transport system component